MFCYENKVVYPVYLSDRDDTMDSLLISNGFVSHYVHIKDFDRFIFNKTKYKGKRYLRKCCLQCFSGKSVLSEHKKDCLVINGKQNVKLESGFIKLTNYSRQIPIPFKIYADSECILKKVDVGISNNDVSYTKKYQDHVPCSFASKVVYVDNRYSKKFVLYRGKNTVFRFIKSVLNEYNYCRRIMGKYFCKHDKHEC